MSDFYAWTPLAEVREWVEENADDGVTCPCCGQFAKRYRRKIHSTMARDLIKLSRRVGWGRYVRVNAELSGGGRPPHLGDFAKLAYWGLIEEHPAQRGDGGRAGWWKITEDGDRFVSHDLRVPKYAVVYNGAVVSHDGEMVNISDALGDKFDYWELMNT